MDPTEINRLKREITQLVKAEMDMKLVADAATIIGNEWSSHRILETGLIVTYCRAYTLDSKRRKPVTLQMLPIAVAGRSLHDTLFDLRDSVYAHSDETPSRVVVDPFGEHRYAEGYYPLPPDVMPVIRDLARQQEGRFRLEISERERQLQKSGVPPTPL